MPASRRVAHGLNWLARPGRKNVSAAVVRYDVRMCGFTVAIVGCWSFTALYARTKLTNGLTRRTTQNRVHTRMDSDANRLTPRQNREVSSILSIRQSE